MGGNEASLVEWSKQDGDTVEVGDIVCLVEGDKVVTEVESIDSGVLSIAPTCPPPGQVVPVGTILGYLLAPGEAAPFAHDTSGAESQSGGRSLTAAVDGASGGPHASAAGGAGADISRAEKDAGAISPRARRAALELGVDWTTLTGSGRSGRIVERDVRDAERRLAGAARITPLARRVARETGVDLAGLALGKPGERIRRADVESAAHPAAQTVTALPVSSVNGVRRLVAERLTTSMRTVAPVTLTTEADATAFVQLRHTINADASAAREAPVSYSDLLAKLVALALSEHPQLNSSLVGGEIVQHATVNVGIAVDTERGLLVPVVRDVLAKPIRRVAEEAAALIRAARSGRIAAERPAGRHLYDYQPGHVRDRRVHPDYQFA